MWFVVIRKRLPTPSLGLSYPLLTDNAHVVSAMYAVAFQMRIHTEWSNRPATFAAWLVEHDVMAQRGQPILPLVSRVFLRDRGRIIQQLTDTGHLDLLCYMLQQVEQFRRLGEAFAMQHKDVKYMGEVEEELLTSVLESIPLERRMRGIPLEEWLGKLAPEERLRGLPPEERLRGLRPKERLRGVSFEELVGDLSEEQRAQLRELLERHSDS